MRVHDLKSRAHLSLGRGNFSWPRRRRWSCARWAIRVYAVDGFFATPRVSGVRGTLWRASSLRGFSCRDQFLCLGFAQLTFRESLRDIETCLRAIGSKLYHAGFRGKISRSTLADANRAHDCASCRLCAGVDSPRSSIVRPRTVGRRVGTDRLRARLDDHRLVSECVSVGEVSPTQKRGQVAHAAGCAAAFRVLCIFPTGKCTM